MRERGDAAGWEGEAGGTALAVQRAPVAFQYPLRKLLLPHHFPDDLIALAVCVSRVGGTEISIRRAGGGTETIAAGANVEVVRDGRPTTLQDIQPDDRVPVERNANGRAVRIVATSRVGATDAGNVITGTVATAQGNTFTVRTQDGNTREIRVADAQNLEVTRNGRDATV